MSTAVGVKTAASVGTRRTCHSSGVCAVEDQRPQGILGAGDGGLGDDDGFFALGDFGFRLHDVDRRHRADLDPGAVLLERALRQVERQPLDFQAADREHQVPVGVLDQPGCHRHRLAQQHVGDLAVLGRHLQRLAGEVDAAVAQQRQREVEGHRRADLRIEVGKGVVGGRPVVLPADAVTRSEPWQVGSEVEVDDVLVVGDGRLATREEAVGRGVAIVALVQGVEARGPERPRLIDAQALDLGTDPHHLEVGVLLDGELDGVHDAQAALWAGRCRCLRLNSWRSENGQAREGHCGHRLHTESSNPGHFAASPAYANGRGVVPQPPDRARTLPPFNRAGSPEIATRIDGTAGRRVLPMAPDILPADG